MKVGTQIFDAIFQKIHNEGYKFIAISVLVTFHFIINFKILRFYRIINNHLGLLFF